MKKTNDTQKLVVKQVKPKCYICGRSGKIYALISLVGIFVCGAMLGWFQSNYVNKKNAVEPVKNIVVEHEGEKLTPCQVREEALLRRIVEFNHYENARTYAMLVKIGCPENVEKYTELAINEKQISDAESALDNNGTDYTVQPNDAPCLVIEKNLLKHGLKNDCEYKGDAYECYANNAQVYAQAAKEGCPEHAEFYKQRALEQIQISDGIRPQNLYRNAYEGQTVSIVNAYNALQMKEQAKKYLKKIEKLVGPGVDFIMEIQRTIEE